MKIYNCRRCGEEFSKAEIDEFREMDEHFWLVKKTGTFMCPDCWDNFNRQDLEDQVKELLEEKENDD